MEKVMDPSLKAEILGDGKVIRLSTMAADPDKKIIMFGSSCPKTLPNGEVAREFFINLENEDPGRDNAICFYYRGCVFTFRITWRKAEEGDDAWKIDMVKNIVPLKDRLYQTFPGYHAFSVIINGVYYTSKFIKNLKGKQRVVNNGDLLCRYLVGKANANDVMIAATEAEDEKNEIEALQNMVELLSKERTGHLRLIEELEKIRQKYFDVSKQLNELRDTTKKFLVEFNKLLDMLGWFNIIPIVRSVRTMSRSLTEKTS